MKIDGPGCIKQKKHRSIWRGGGGEGGACLSVRGTPPPPQCSPLRMQSACCLPVYPYSNHPRLLPRPPSRSRPAQTPPVAQGRGCLLDGGFSSLGAERMLVVWGMLRKIVDQNLSAPRPPLSESILRAATERGPPGDAAPADLGAACWRFTGGIRVYVNRPSETGLFMSPLFARRKNETGQQVMRLKRKMEQVMSARLMTCMMATFDVKSSKRFSGGRQRGAGK